MQKSTGILISIVTFLFGVLLGILAAPVKKGLTITGNNNYNYYDGKEECSWNEGEWDDEDDCCECAKDDEISF